MAGQKTISSSYSGPLVPPIVIDSFENYVLGPLHGQGGWVNAGANILVQSVYKSHGLKAAYFIGTGTFGAVKPVANLKEGLVSCDISRIDVVSSVTMTSTILLHDSAERAIGQIGVYNDTISYQSNQSYITMLTPIVRGQFYRVSIQWRTIPVPQVRYRLDDGAWTAWVTRAQFSSVDASGHFDITYNATLIAKSFCWDNIS